MPIPLQAVSIILLGGQAQRTESEIEAVEGADTLAEVTNAQITTFFNAASEEQLQELYDSLGVNIENFYDSIEPQVADYQIGNETIGTDPSYEPSTTIDAIAVEYKDEVEDIVQAWIISNNSDAPLQRFDDFIDTPEIRSEIKSKITEPLINEKGWGQAISEFFGGDPSLAINAAAARARIQQTVDDSPIPDDEETARKAENISNAEAKQCVLLNLLGPLSQLCDDALLSKCTNDVGTELNGLPYSGRIVKLDNDNPTSFMNYLSNVPGINANLTEKRQDSKEYISADNMKQYYRLSFIKKHNGSLFELPVLYQGGFNFNTIQGSNVSSEPAAATSFSTDPVSDESDGGYGTTRSAAQTEDRYAPITVKPTDELSNTVLDELNDFKIDITYQGSNPSTYRNDVDVKITFTAPTLNTFLKSWTYDGIQDDKNIPIKFTLFDLILFPYLEKDAQGYGKIYKSQYSPNYNRVRLAYASGFEKGGDRSNEFIDFFNKNSNVLDLAVVDHEFKREEEGTRYVLSIHYKGYVQSVLTSPETDVLSTPEIKRKRLNRDIILKRAIEKDCSLREIQKIQTQLNRLAQNDVMDVSSGIITSLYTRGVDGTTLGEVKGLGIYKLNLDSALERALSRDDKGINFSELKKRIVDPDNNRIAKDIGVQSPSTLAQGQGEAELDDFSTGSKNIYFFYLADLLDTAILNSGIFKNSKSYDDDVDSNAMAQKIRFIMGSFVTPTNEVINIGNIPISVDFFLEWYNETITKKELFIYPCLSFIRDIAEKVVTNMLNRVCFEGLEETKLLVRTSFLTGTKQGGVDPLFRFYGDKYAERVGLKETPQINLDQSGLTNTDLPLIRTNFEANILDYVNYCVIFTRENNRARNLQRNIEIPTFFLEYDPIRFGVKTSNFSRVQQTGLRESRYFRNSQSGITMLASVYNVDLELTHPIHFVYPGQFFKIDINSPPEFNINVGGNSRSIFEELGLNGFYAVQKVTTSINARTLIISTKVSGIFIGSDSPYSVRKFNPNNQSLEQAPPTPQEIACDSFVQLSEEIGVLESTGQIGEDAIQNLIEEIIVFSEQPLESIQLEDEIPAGEATGAGSTTQELANEALQEVEGLTDEEINDINETYGSPFS